MSFHRYVRDGAIGLGKAVFGIDPAHPRVIVARRKICVRCPLRRQGLCRACGCIIKAKTMVRGEACPKGRW
jgi:hypothetical protein